MVIGRDCAMAGLRQGDHFRITGPHNCWRPTKDGGWQPRAWTAPPGAVPRGEVVRDTVIDFSQTFAVDYILNSKKFRSAQVQLPNVNRSVWINIAKHDRDWVEKVDIPPVKRRRLS